MMHVCKPTNLGSLSQTNVQKRKECPLPSLVSMKGALLIGALLHYCGTDVVYA